MDMTNVILEVRSKMSGRQAAAPKGVWVGVQPTQSLCKAPQPEPPDKIIKLYKTACPPACLPLTDILTVILTFTLTLTLTFTFTLTACFACFKQAN